MTAASAAVRRNPVALICVLALAASVTSLTNGFSLDDVHLIPDNEKIHSLSRFWEFFAQTYWPPAHGSSLYRPLTVLAFAIQWAIGGGSPLPFHVVSIVLYVVSCVALYRLVAQIVDRDAALVGAALFAIHPVHTEAVANVVGQGELLAAIFVFVAVERYIRARRSGSIRTRDTVIIAASYLLGLLSKEHAVVLPALLLAAEVLIQGGERGIRQRLRNVAVTLVSLITVAVGFVIVRTSVTGGMRAAGINEILSGEPFSARAFTMLNVVLEWIRLLFWPAQLSADYSFPRTRVATSLELGMLPAVVIIIGCAVIAWRLRKSMPAVTFAILWFAVTMAIPSNLIMVTGFVLAERTLFLPSLAVVLIAGVVLTEAWKYIGANEPVRRGLLAAAVGIVVVCGVARSAVRNPAWRDNETLFLQTVDDVPFSARAHWMLSEHFAKTNRRGPAAEEMMLAVALGRKDDFILLGFAADQFNLSGMCPRAMPLYRRALALTPQNEQLRANASLCLMKLGRIEEARSLASAGFDRNSSSEVLIRSVAIADSLTRLSRTHMAQ